MLYKLWISDAFAQEGIAPDGKEAPGWMNDWTIFYWGWWIAWSPYVGMFIAKISRGKDLDKKLSVALNYSSCNSKLFEKILNILFFALSHISGRTIKDFLMYTLTIPCLYSFLWFSMFGGVGVKMENLARQANLTCDSPLGGTKSTESFNGLYLLSCRY